MFPPLLPLPLAGFSMTLRLAMSGRSLRSFVVSAASGVTFVKLLGAIRAFEVMALAGNAN